MGKIYLVAGIDTGVGKTVATGQMARDLRSRGVDAITVKLVQTGNDGYSEDIDAHRAIMGCRFPEDDQGLTAPQIASANASAFVPTSTRSCSLRQPADSMCRSRRIS